MKPTFAHKPAIPHPRDYDQCFLVSGPYMFLPLFRGNGDPTMVYEVCLCRRGERNVKVAQCRQRSTAIDRAKRERAEGAYPDAPIFYRFPSEDPILLTED